MAENYDFISSGVKPVHSEGMQAATARAMQLRDIGQQSQMRQQQIAEGDIKLRAAKRDEADQAKWIQHYTASGGDMNKAVKSAAQDGVGPRTLLPILDHIAKVKKELASTDEITLKNDAVRHDQLRGQIMAFEQQPDEAKVQSYPQAVAQWHQSGLLNDQEYAQAVQAHPQYPGADTMNLYAAGLRTGTMATKEVLDQAEEKRKAAEEGRKAALAGPQLEKAKADASAATVTAGQVAELGMSKKDKATLDATLARNADTARHEKVLEGQGAQRVSIERQNSNRAQKQFDLTYGALAGPDGKPMDAEAAKAFAIQDPVAVAIANYQMAPPTASRGGPGAGILRKVMAIDPNYDAKNWKQQGDTLKDFNTGKSASELGATSVAFGHLGVMKEAVTALNNTDLRMLNAIANRLGVETGSSAAAVFRTIVHRVGPEVAKAYIAGGGGVHERGATEADFDPALGPKVLLDNIAISGRLLDGKIEQKQSQWKAVMGDKPMPGLSPAAVEARKTIGNSGGKVKLKAPNGQITDVSADQVDHYLSRGAKRVSN